MKLESLHFGMQVRHPQYGIGQVRSISEHTVDVQFDSGSRTLDPATSGLTPAEAHAGLSGMEMPLHALIQSVVDQAVDRLGLGSPEEEIQQLGVRWHGGKMVLHPADPTLQTKDIAMEVFFHKIVMIRNNLRVLEQKINAHPGLSDGEKVEMQQYVTRCYGSLTSFNLLFRRTEDQFGS